MTLHQICGTSASYTRETIITLSHLKNVLILQQDVQTNSL